MANTQVVINAVAVPGWVTPGAVTHGDTPWGIFEQKIILILLTAVIHLLYHLIYIYICIYIWD